jgi:phosphotriesterase-related protein
MMIVKLFLPLIFSLLLFSQCKDDENRIIMTVNGPVKASQAGISLIHEHILVDFIGADSINSSRYDRAIVIAKALPYLKQIYKLGCRTFVDCTPEFLGRDPLLLKSLSDSSGLNIITNTGYYGAYNNKYIPEYALTESADQLAARWTMEWEKGIGETGIKPGFIKIAVDKDSLSLFHKKLITAAARTHLKTGLTIVSHTGPYVPAFQQLEILASEGVAADAFIWVHALNEKNRDQLIAAAQRGAWISLDKLNEKNIEEHLSVIKILKANGLLNKVLLSHDAGWFDPAKENGGNFRGYTTLFEKLIPALRGSSFSENEITQILVLNPANAFRIGVRKK